MTTAADAGGRGPTTVSVVIPALNAVRFIRESVDSVLSQRDLSLRSAPEVIVVDNGSTDGTPDVVRRTFGDRVRVVSEISARGIGPARNAGIAIATGDAIATLDADDVWLPEKLSLQMAVLEACPDVAMVFCHGTEFADPPGSAPCRGGAGPFVSGSALLARRDALAAAGPFPTFRSGEFIAWYGLAQALGLRSHVLPDVLVRRRVHASNSTRDRSSLADYPLAMRWLLEKRRALESGKAAPR